MRYRDLSVAGLAGHLGMTRATVNNYTSGKSRLNVEMIEGLAEALQVEPAVLLMEPDDAIRWVLDNSPNSRKGEFALSITDNHSYLDGHKAA